MNKVYMVWNVNDKRCSFFPAWIKEHSTDIKFVPLSRIKY